MFIENIKFTDQPARIQRPIVCIWQRQNFSRLRFVCYFFRWFMKPQHVDPTEAVQVHEEIGAKTSLGIHWGTFRMTIEVSLKRNVIGDIFVVFN